MAGKFPIVALTGIRQSGKSTLLRNLLPKYRYVSLEDIDMRNFARDDSKGFLNEYSSRVIIDEAQRVPDLFSYIQTKTDAEGETGQYVLSGSHNFLLMESISQSLAGRCAVLNMAPFSLKELVSSSILPDGTWEQMLLGGFPRIYDKKIGPEDYFPGYVATYIEKDVLSVRRITDASLFLRFVRLCAARSGQLLRINELAKDADVSVPTAMSWLSILEQSFVIFLLRPYYRNFSKRLVKSPKLYFLDTGLLCYLLDLYDTEQLKKSSLSGSIFETFVVSEYIKSCFFAGMEPRCYYFRDSTGNEIDLLTENRGKLEAYEIKTGETMNRKYMKPLVKFGNIAGLGAERLHLIYRGETVNTSYGQFVNYTGVW